MTNEIPTTIDCSFQHGLMATNRSNETLPIVIQSSTIKPTNTSITRNNPKLKRNLRDKRRATGILPDEALIVGTSNEDTLDEDEEKVFTHITESNESFDYNQTMPSSNCSTPMFTVSRIQPSFENLSISEKTDSYIRTSSPSLKNNSDLVTKNFRPEKFIVHRVEQQTSDDDSVKLKSRQFEERILTLESRLYDKDIIIHDLQRKLDKMTRELTDAKEQIYILHQEKLTLIKAFSALQDNKPLSEDVSIHSKFK
ncbi:unnamed protein product [Rotaria sordida]|uniref:Uncharacterized protein n=1 Tax=Rotaria sordida TaxID=392033 RepID=A0A815T902_9BILA|nr:unnamed protein product [Rotaria sordida]CAF1503257.1 unnamed protein product [Rotaria sordida]